MPYQVAKNSCVWPWEVVYGSSRTFKVDEEGEVKDSFNVYF